MDPALTPDWIWKVLELASTQSDRTPLPPFSSITTDSRQVTPGSLFVPLRGDQFDGHDFIEQAIQAGAKGILSEHDVQAPEGVVVFRVKDTLAAYRRIAAAWRRLFKIPLVVVAGSVGKTTCKEFLAAMLKGRFKEVLKTEKSQNGFIGIPLTLLDLRPEHQVAVIEVGIDAPGAMAQHMDLVHADVSLLTAIEEEHLEYLKDIDTVAAEESIALRHVAAHDGRVIINMDDPRIARIAEDLHCKGAICFSLEDEVVAKHWVRGSFNPHQKSLHVSTWEGAEFAVEVPLPGRHNATNLLAAIATSLSLGLTPEQMLRGLSHFEGADGRSSLKELSQGVQVLCDYYNANPASTRAGLRTLTELAQGQKDDLKKRHVCLGDMLELGPNEENYHRELAKDLIQMGVEGVYLFGSRMKWLFDELQKLQYKGHMGHYVGHEELVAELKSRLLPGDAILIKGSRGMKMEKIWTSLQA